MHGLATGTRPFANAVTSPIALVGQTIGDVREVMIDGPAGVRNCALYQRPTYEASRRRLVWPNGVVAYAFSAHEPESLRGPQFAAAWCDEMCKWPHAQATWDMLQFGLRLGDWPRQLITTTPKPLKVIKNIMSQPTTISTHMKTMDNARNLAPSFMKQMQQRYGNTQLGRQELEGELIEAREDALWTRKNLEQHRVNNAPDLSRIVVAVDPPATSKVTSDSCGIIVAGCTENGHAYVLADRTIGSATPNRWAGRAIGEYLAWNANLLLAEVNQGGEMVASVIRAINADIAIKTVHATRGKWLRAEPVAALYEQGRVHHVTSHAALEDELCDFAIDGLSSGRSPDRLDACVWAINELLMHQNPKPRIRDFS